MPLLMIQDLFIIITGVAALEKQTLTPGVHLGLGPQSSTSPAWLVHTRLPQCQRPVLRSKTAGCDQEGTGSGGQGNPICQQCHSMREAHWTQPTCPTLTSTCTPFTHSLAGLPASQESLPRPPAPSGLRSNLPPIAACLLTRSSSACNCSRHPPRGCPPKPWHTRAPEACRDTAFPAGPRAQPHRPPYSGGQAGP